MTNLDLKGGRTAHLRVYCGSHRHLGAGWERGPCSPRRPWGACRNVGGGENDCPRPGTEMIRWGDCVRNQPSTTHTPSPPARARRDWRTYVRNGEYFGRRWRWDRPWRGPQGRQGEQRECRQRKGGGATAARAQERPATQSDTQLVGPELDAKLCPPPPSRGLCSSSAGAKETVPRHLERGLE